MAARLIPTTLVIAALGIFAACSNDKDEDNPPPGGNNNPPPGGNVSPSDPAPLISMPGEYGCPGCPDTTISEFELTAGSEPAWTFEGDITAALGDGIFFTQGPNGEEVFGPIPTDLESGTFSFTTPLFCGTQLVKCVWSNDAGTYV